MDQSGLSWVVPLGWGSSVSGVFSGFWFVLASSLQVVDRDLVVGGVVGFYLFMFLRLSDDGIVGVSANIDDRTEVTGRRVVEITSSLLIHLVHAVPTLDVFCIGKLAVLLTRVAWAFSLGVHQSLDHHGYINTLVDVIEEVIMIIIQLDEIQSFVVHASVNQEYITFRSEAFGAPLAVAFIFIVGGN